MSYIRRTIQLTAGLLTFRVKYSQPRKLWWANFPTPWKSSSSFIKRSLSLKSKQRRRRKRNRNRKRRRRSRSATNKKSDFRMIYVFVGLPCWHLPPAQSFMLQCFHSIYSISQMTIFIVFACFVIDSCLNSTRITPLSFILPSASLHVLPHRCFCAPISIDWLWPIFYTGDILEWWTVILIFGDWLGRNPGDPYGSPALFQRSRFSWQ